METLLDPVEHATRLSPMETLLAVEKVSCVRPSCLSNPSPGLDDVNSPDTRVMKSPAASGTDAVDWFT